MKLIIKKILPNSFHSYIFYLIAIFTILNIINTCKLHFTIIILLENQILYIFSSLAQIVGALLGLTIAGYSIMDSKLKSLGDSDSSITEYTDELRSNYFSSLMSVIILSIIDIIMCISILSIYNNWLDVLLPFLSIQALIIFIFIMIEIIYFVNFLNPNKLNELGSSDKESIEKGFKTSTSSSSGASFDSFVTTYNLLEKLIRDYACELVGGDYFSSKFQIINALNVLVKYEIINRQTLSIINELRRYRNALVHSLDTDKSVNQNVYAQLEGIYSNLKDIYENRNDEKLSAEKRNSLYSYSKNLGFGERENRVIDYLNKNDTASISELSEFLNLSRTGTIKTISNLQELGVLENIGKTKHTRWAIKK